MKNVSTDQDNSLISAIKGENESASFKELFDKYRPLVNKAAKRYHFRFQENEDLIQEARIVCYQTALAYDSSTNVSFGKFFQRSLLNRYCSLLRKESAKKRMSDRYAESFDKLLETQGDFVSKSDLPYPNSLAIILSKEIILSMSESRSEMEYSIFNLLVFEHYTPEHICSDLNLSRTRVHRAMSRSRAKLAARFGDM